MGTDSKPHDNQMKGLIMTDQNVNNSEKHHESDKRDSQATARDWFSCCGLEAKGAIECPCVLFFRKHFLAALGILFVMLLMVLISQVGGILGIIAFVRTL